MKTITLKVDENIFDKFQWLLKHFSKDEIVIVNEIDTSKLSSNDFDYISSKKLEELKKISNDYKQGKRDDFEEYAI